MTANETSPTCSSLETETVKGSCLFEIKGYSSAKGLAVGKYIRSDVFTVGGYKWAIYFYPYGKKAEDNSKYVSVYIALVSHGRNVRTLFELTLMDQSGKGRHRVRTHFKKGLPRTLKYMKSLWGLQRYSRRDLLEKSDFLRNDCLKFYCTIGVVIDRSLSLSIKVPDSDIGSHIGMLLENMEGCDVTFNVSGEKLHAHKFILAARSTKFRAELLEGVGTEGEEVMIPDMEPEVFKAMLHFIYSDSSPENELISSTSCSAPLVADSLTAKLLAAADLYDLERLKRICESHLCKDISVNSIKQVLALADRCHAAELKVVCVKFLITNLAAIVPPRSFEYFKRIYLSLESSRLKSVVGSDEDRSNDGCKPLLITLDGCDKDCSNTIDVCDEDCSNTVDGCDKDCSNTVDGCDEDLSNGGGMSGSVRAELCGGDDNSGRRVKQRVEEINC